MMQAINTISYGKITIEEGYKDGTVINRIQTVQQTIKITSRQELLDVLFDQLKRLKEGEDCITFEVHADKYSHEPVRIITTSKQRLD